MIKKNRNRLQVLNGLRQSSRHSPPSHVQRQSWPAEISGSHADFFYPQTDELGSVLTAMERRVNGLLEDRRRVGRDLHDNILQSLYAMGLHLEASRDILPHPLTQSTQLRSQLVAQLNHLIQEVRMLIQSLEADTIQDFDMTEEMASLQEIYEMGGHRSIQLHLDQNALDSLTNEEKREFLNIAREALSNCARHAGATHITVDLHLNGTSVFASIVDDGKGFVASGNHHRGYGLANMETRAKKLGGTFHMRSAIGQGTAITIEFPQALMPVGL